jgi:hypothetical protein
MIRGSRWSYCEAKSEPLMFETWTRVMEHGRSGGTSGEEGGDGGGVAGRGGGVIAPTRKVAARTVTNQQSNGTGDAIGSSVESQGILPLRELRLERATPQRSLATLTRV